MRRQLAALLCAVAMIGLAGCGSSPGAGERIDKAYESCRGEKGNTVAPMKHEEGRSLSLSWATDDPIDQFGCVNKSLGTPKSIIEKIAALDDGGYGQNDFDGITVGYGYSNGAISVVYMPNSAAHAKTTG